jgi:hypothetical protein
MDVYILRVQGGYVRSDLYNTSTARHSTEVHIEKNYTLKSTHVCTSFAVDSKTRTRERGSTQGVLKRNISTYNRLEEGLRHNRRSSRTGMCVV